MRFVICRGLIFISFVSSLTARAGLFVEPFGGFTYGPLTQSGQPIIHTEAFILGGRLGYQLVDTKFGVDYMLGFGKVDQYGTKANYRPKDLGIFFGYELPFGFEAYGSGFVSSKAKISPSDNPADFSGLSFRFGFGWDGLPYGNLNFEAIYRIYNKYNGVDLSNSIKGTTMGVSLSFPMP